MPTHLHQRKTPLAPPRSTKGTTLPGTREGGLMADICYASRKKLAKGQRQRFAEAVYAGIFIGLGFVFYLTVTTGSAGAPWGMVRLAGALAFSLGLMLVVLLGMELFTGTVLTAIPWVQGSARLSTLLKSWLCVYCGNALGALSLAVLVLLAGVWQLDGGLWGVNLVSTALHKLHHGWWEAFFLGVLCNFLVCLGVWLSFLSANPGTRALLLMLPVALFVSSGFEHSIANLFLLPLAGMLAQHIPDTLLLTHGIEPARLAELTPANMLQLNLLPVTLGNIVGGAVLVGMGLLGVHRLGERSAHSVSATPANIGAGLSLVTTEACVSVADGAPAGLRHSGQPSQFTNTHFKPTPSSPCLTPLPDGLHPAAASPLSLEQTMMNKHLNTLTVSALLEPAVTLTPDMNLWQSLALMESAGGVSCPVVADGGRLVGMLAPQDAMRGLWAEEFAADGSYRVGDMMQKVLHTVAADEPLLTVLEYWVVDRQRLFPVTGEGHWLGTGYQAYEERLRGAVAASPATLPVVDAGVLKGVIHRDALLRLLQSVREKVPA
ncbi:formate transporter FocA [Shewanella zhangzhouensis]|uniref:formate transporter FocA n=1 Tax=Shewanella zhangzhouensis TaxID=2864213 RepID=UPI001C65F86E|nr:formate transporter FocA [Shewanella zhangzhouensis]QYK06743.1 formate transporter FocA [Shewanella zhangzhouensis]